MKLPLDATATRIFATEPSGWMPSLEPLLTRFGLQVRFWQLGSDHDLSLATDPEVVAKVARVQKEFAAISSGFRLGIPWRTDMPLATAKKLPWRYLSLTTPAGQDPDSFIPYLEASKKSSAELWVMLDPPPHAGQSSVDRATALVRQMLEAKIHGAQASAIPTWSVTSEGSWKTTALPANCISPAHRGLGTQRRTNIWAARGSRTTAKTMSSSAATRPSCWPGIPNLPARSIISVPRREKSTCGAKALASRKSKGARCSSSALYRHSSAPAARRWPARARGDGLGEDSLRQRVRHHSA